MKLKCFALLALSGAVFFSCSDKNDNGGTTQQSVLQAPSDIAVTQLSETSFDIRWTDNSKGETGFGIYLINANDIDNPRLCGNADADATQYTLTQEGMEYSKSYYIGVKALAEDSRYDSKMAKQMFTTAPEPDPYAPKVSVKDIKGSAVCVAVSLQMENVAADLDYGVCWGTDENVEKKSANCQRAAAMSGDDAGAVKVMVSNVLLDYGKEYYFRGYAVKNGSTVYSEAVKCSLADAPQAISLNWKDISDGSLPASVRVYETTDKLNGRNFHAWYAVADLSKGEVEFKVAVPDKAMTIDDQSKANAGCLVMVNGGYFYNGRNTGIAYVDGVASGSVTAVRGSLKAADAEYNEMYTVTRGIFGVDAEGKASVYWGATDASGKNYFFPRPMPSVKGEAKYGPVSATNPTDCIQWNPKYAQSAGPLLLKDGKCPFDFATTDKGEDFYSSNFEIMPYDIYGPSVKPDRTAAGYTADGRVILFICDGRIEESDGATLTELAMIMKGLGCVGAVNFDGGGSTGMMMCGVHLNDTAAENRPVVSTLGFYKK